MGSWDKAFGLAGCFGFHMRGSSCDRFPQVIALLELKSELATWIDSVRLHCQQLAAATAWSLATGDDFQPGPGPFGIEADLLG